MDIFLGYAGVAVAFVIMMSVLLMIMIKSKDISWKLKLVLVPFVIWYSVALYHVPSNFMGWPTETWSIQNEVIILDWHVEEKKAIYFWVVDYNIKNVRALIDPRHAFFPFIDDTPRAYKIVYNSDLHKRLVAQHRKMKQMRRGSMTMHLEKLQGFQQFDANEVFKIFDPAEVLKKNPEE